MQKLTKKLSLVMVALMTVFTALSYVPAKAATVVPKVQFVGEQKLEYTAGERITFNLNAANYGGRVQYRVVLWNDAKKSYSDLWNTADKYYTNWMPYGNETLPLGWVINEPGTYRITVYAKRAGLANSKTALKGSNCDSYLAGPAFVVKPAAAPVAESIAPVTDVTVNAGSVAVLPTEVTLNMSDKTTKTAKVTWAAVDTTKVGTVVVEGTVEGTTIKAKVNVTVVSVALAVQSVSAINTKQIKVVFNKAVDETLAEDETNYVVQGIASGLYTATLLDDAKTVLLTLNTAQTQGTNLSVSVKNIQDEDLTEIVPVSFGNAIFTDIVSPAITDVTAVANKIVKITLSEPVAGLTVGDFKLNGSVLGVFGGASITPSVGTTDAYPTNQQYTLTFNNALAAASYTLEYTAANSRTDAAGFPIAKTTQTFTVANVTGAPTATVETAKSGTNGIVKVTFDRVMDSATLITTNFMLNTTGVTAVSRTISSDGKSVTLTFGTVSSGANVLLIAPGVSDAYGNALSTGTANIRVIFTASADTTAPTLLSAVASSETVIKLTFDEAIDSITGNNNANYIIVDAAGNKVAPISSRTLTPVVGGTGNKEVTITLGSKLAGGTYTVTVSNLKDIAANVMVATAKSFSITDLTAPTFSDKDSVNGGTQAAVIDNTNKTVEVFFREAMDISSAFSVLDKNNWTYKGLALPAYVSVAPGASNKSVIFTFGSTDTLTVGDVWEILVAKDVAGNLMTRTSTTGVVISAVGTPYIVDGTVEALAGTSANDQVKFELDQTLATFDFTQFVVTKSGAPVAVTGGTLANKVVTLTVANGALGDGTAVTLDVTGVPGNANANGGQLDTETLAPLDANDAIVPHMISATKVGSTIQVVFNEALNMNFVGLFKSDFVVDNNGATIVPSTTTVGGNNRTVVLNFASTITLAGANIVVYPASTVANVKDASDNVWVPNSTETNSGVALDLTAPVVAGVVDTTVYDDTVTATFTEGTATLAKNGAAAAPYTSGTPITAHGNYVLVVTDASANATTVNFSVKSSLASFTPVTLTQTGGAGAGDTQYVDAAAVQAALPTTITVTLTNGETVAVPVTWLDTDIYDAGTAGTYTFTAVWGTLPTNVDNADSLAVPTVDLVVAP